MSFLRRLFGGGSGDDGDDGDHAGSDDRDHARATAEPADPAAVEADERARELELARFDQDRIDDLVRRQQRYADRSWTLPAQGGERRADDGDATDDNAAGR